MKDDAYLVDPLHEYMNRTGTQPTRIYLGDYEFKELKSLIAQFMVFGSSPCFPTKRETWRGLEVFRVDADKHVGFGWDGPVKGK